MVVHRKIRLVLAVMLGVVTISVAPPVSAAPKPSEQIDLPDGFRPEGIVVGKGSSFYVGSLGTGALFKGDVNKGTGAVIHPGNRTPSVGLAIDNNELVYVAGGGLGTGKVIDGRTGALLRTYAFTAAPTFVNDVVVAGGFAWFTDSQRPQLYRVPLGGGAGGVTTVPLSGDYVHVTPGLNLNGIEATPDGKTLLAVQTVTGKLFTIDPATGATKAIDTGGADLTNGDGLLLQGHTLYVVRNFSNAVVVLRLSPDLSSGAVVSVLTSPNFDVPTTVDRKGATLYLVNARFTTSPSPTTAYWITVLNKKG